MNVVLICFFIQSWLIFVTAVNKLPPYNTTLSQSSVSGHSSGAAFAVQFHVAFSSVIVGAGILAGAPYHCAQGEHSYVDTTCQKGDDPPLDVALYIKVTHDRASLGLLDDPSNLKNSRVFMFSGTLDDTVNQTVMDATYRYYANFMDDSAILYNKTAKANHTYPTDNPINKNLCSESDPPYISDCDYDGPGVLLQQIFGELNPRNDGTLSAVPIEFDQSEFIPNNQGMGMVGYVYIPASCSTVSCKVHVALHGCRQSVDFVDMDFINHVGYNKWADTNDIIVVYPQAQASEENPANHAGCWDWWGYTDPSNYDDQSGVQMKAIYGMLQKLSLK